MMSFDCDEIIKQTDLLSPDVKNKIIWNKKLDVIYSSTYVDYTNNDSIRKLEDLINSGAINKKSLFDKCTKNKICHFDILSLKNTHIYKTFLGFPNDEQILKYCQENLNKPSYFGNKYICYSIARSIFGGIVVYQVCDNLNLIDLFNIKNIKLLVKCAKKYLPEELLDDFIFNLCFSTGYSYALHEQITNLSKIKKNWNELWLYSKRINLDKSYTYQHVNNVDGLNPISSFKGSYSFIDVLFKYILIHFSEIDGIIKQQIYSNFEENGVYYQEEIILKCSSQLNKLVINHNHKLHWKQLNLKLNLNFSGILLKWSFERINLTNNIQKNQDFGLFKYYLEHNCNIYPAIENGIYILTYNVNSLNHLSTEVNRDSNFKLFYKLIENYKKFIQILFFQEIYFINDQERIRFIDMLASLDYKYHISTKNGNNKMYLFCFSKEKVNFQLITIDKCKHIDEKIKHLNDPWINTNLECHRNQILIKYNSFLICGVHLSVGYKNKIENKIENSLLNDKINELNVLLRKYELSQILKYNPDILIGDFNFSVKSKEHFYLLGLGYNLYSHNEKSTPYNRVDHIYSKIKISEQNLLISQNNSDHLPFLAKIS